MRIIRCGSNNFVWHKTETMRSVVLVMTAILATANAKSGMIVDSYSGPVNDKEIQSFADFIQELKPGTNGNVGNEWAQGHSGENLKAMALVYDISQQQKIMDKMILFCDTLLSQRNDLWAPPNGQLVIWTGRIDPVWPNNLTSKPVGTGGEQGDPVGHLANCGRQILQTPQIYNKTVNGGDPHNFGKTYLERAERYVAEADKSMDQHVVLSLLNLTNRNYMYFAKNSPYKGGDPVPWNQQMMFNYAFVNLAQAHELLQDEADRVKRYDQVVKANSDWYFQHGVTHYYNKEGRHTYDWAYAMPKVQNEDSNHGALDTAGLNRLYDSKRYGLTADDMTPIANAIYDVMRVGVKSEYSGEVNGKNGTSTHSQPTTYLRSGYMVAAQFRPDAYPTMMSDAGIKEGGTTTSVPNYSRYLWVKYKLYGKQ